MSSPWLAWIVLVGLAVVVAAYLRNERRTSRSLAAQQQALLGEVLTELTELRSALVAGGAVESKAKPPATPWPALPSVERRVVSVTRDDDPVHTRPTVEAPPPAGEVRAAEEPPSTKPSPGRAIPPAAPRSAPRPVSFDDQVGRAMRRLERQVRVPLDVEARWMARLAALRTELGLHDEVTPTDEQLEAMIRELYQAEADVKDARDAAVTGAVVPDAAAPPAEATLPSAVSPVAVRIAEVASRAPDADGEATLRRDRPASLPRATAHEEDDEGDTGEPQTTVYSRRPGEADAQIPGVEVKPTAARPRPRRPSLLGGLAAPRAPQGSEYDEGEPR